MELLAILQGWQRGSTPIATELAQVWQLEGADSGSAHAFGLNEENGLEQMEWRSQLFQQLLPAVMAQVKTLGFSDENAILLSFWRFWLPFCLQLGQIRQSLDRPLIQGILGGQGTGKTTLTEICGFILNALGYASVGLSLDDLYKTYRDRQELLKIDPRLRWRGPPGTHDVELGIQVLKQARQAQRQEPILFPQFDKSLHAGAGDRITPKPVGAVDIIFFEGWFVGVRPVDPALFDPPLDPIVTEGDRQFARDCNQRLQAYLPLWELLDRLLVLHPVDYRLSQPWRKEAERKIKAQKKSGMNEEDIDVFVEYFWKALHPEIFITPLTQIPLFTDVKCTNVIVEIKSDHSLGKIYRPVLSDRH